jgi:DNA polymerase
VEAFANGKDVYKIMASAIYGKANEEISQSERFVGKTTILGAGYGMGAPKFKAQLKTFGVDIEDDTSKRVIDTYRSTYPMIPLLWRESQEALRCMVRGQTMKLGRNDLLTVDDKGILLPNGLYIFYNGIREVADDEGKRQFVYTTRNGPNKIYGGKVVENFTQAVARCIIGEQMLKIAKRYKVVLTVHDAIGIVARREEADEARAYVETCMRWVPAWAEGLPVNCESGMGDSYGDC